LRGCRAILGNSGERSRASRRELAAVVALAVSDAQEIAQRVRAERDERRLRELGMAH
jgi:hypothetical protein